MGDLRDVGGYGNRTCLTVVARVTTTGLLFFGLPVGLGFAGYYGFRNPGEVIYYAP
jgi:hypothetical protein